MFEKAKLLGDTRRRIPLGTRLGNQIPNEVGPSSSPSDLTRWNALLRKYPVRWKERKPPDGTYNCAGHVWGARRTTITSEQAVQQILREDSYRKIDMGKSAVGDFVLFFDVDPIAFLHVGRIIEIQEGDGIVRTPMLLSKMNWGGEVVHSAYDHPYGRDFHVTLECWTDR